jgi:hypothetical protein
MGFSDARVTFIIDSKGVTRCVCVLSPYLWHSHSSDIDSYHCNVRLAYRDALDASLNFGGHSKFIGKWLDKLEAEAAGVSAPTPEVETTGDAGATAEAEPAAEEGPEGVAT